jgi:hypothetical protein
MSLEPRMMPPGNLAPLFDVCVPSNREAEWTMSKRILSVLLAPVAAAIVSGCQTQEQILQSEQGVATQVAVNRGRFELGCPQATGTILSSNVLQPVAWRGQERAEYTIGVEGCGQRKTYIVVCQLGSISCFAAAGRY